MALLCTLLTACGQKSTVKEITPETSIVEQEAQVIDEVETTLNVGVKNETDLSKAAEWLAIAAKDVGLNTQLYEEYSGISFSKFIDDLKNNRPMEVDDIRKAIFILEPMIFRDDIFSNIRISLDDIQLYELRELFAYPDPKQKLNYIPAASWVKARNNLIAKLNLGDYTGSSYSDLQVETDSEVFVVKEVFDDWVREYNAFVDSVRYAVANSKRKYLVAGVTMEEAKRAYSEKEKWSKDYFLVFAEKHSSSFENFVLLPMLYNDKGTWYAYRVGENGMVAKKVIVVNTVEDLPIEKLEEDVE